MTAHSIVHTCGHETDRDLYGTAWSRNWQAEQWARKPCQSCWRADVTAAGAEAAMFAAGRDWPVLEGTDAQVGWAQTIRAELVESLPSRMAELVDMGAARGQTFPDTRGAVLLATAVALEQTSAGWWIGQRQRLADAFAEMPEVRRQVKQAGDTGRTAYALLLWAGAAMGS